MNHGFLTRGDMGVPDIAAEVQNIHKSGLTKVAKCPHDNIYSKAPCNTLFLGVQGHECHSGLHRETIWKPVNKSLMSVLGRLGPQTVGPRTIRP